MMEPLSTPPLEGLDFDDHMSFDSYCIVCDRFIPPAKEAPKEAAKEPAPTVDTETKGKKKPAGGTIRVRNPDGSTTTRTANGQKATRPGIRRNQTSSTRLAAGTNPKIHPLTRTTTSSSSDKEISPKSPTSETPKDSANTTPTMDMMFKSSIYCSKECANLDAGRSCSAYDAIARTLSYDFSNGYPTPHSPHLEHIQTTGLSSKNPYAPPSPLFISESDTESSAASASVARQGMVLGSSGPAASAPKTMEYFRMTRDNPDDAWHERERQRRSSMQAAPTGVRPMFPAMFRQKSQQSQAQSQSHSQSGASSDSLNSLWQNEADLHVARSTSGSGALRGMTPLHHGAAGRDVAGAGKRSSSSSSDGSAALSMVPPNRPLPRSNLSQTSLLTSSPLGKPIPIPAEFGSAPDHTLSLFQNYASAFPVRDACGSSTSYNQRGLGFATPPRGAQSRRGSVNTAAQSSTSLTGAGIQRPSTGTIRIKPRAESGTATTWDALGRETVLAKQNRQREIEASSVAVPLSDSGRSVPGSIGQDLTPRQSLEVENGRWKIKYTAPTPGGRSLSRDSTASTESSESSIGLRNSSASGGTLRNGNAMAIPRPIHPLLSTSSSTATSARTPPARSISYQVDRSETLEMPPPSSLPHRPASAMPNLLDTSSRRSSSTSWVSPDSIQSGAPSSNGTGIATSFPRRLGSATTVPRVGWNWDELEKKGGIKTYALPKGIVPGKSGLFYFQ